MESSLSDFFGQIPLQFILLPIISGVLYIGAMVIVFRRAAERRRKRREAADAVQSITANRDQQELARLRRMVASGQVLGTDSIAASNVGVNPGMSDAVPEPDLDLLTLLDDIPAPVAPVTPAVPARSINVAQSAPPIQQNTSLAMTVTEDYVNLPAAPNTVKEIDTMSARPAASSAQDVPPDAVEVLRVYRDMNDGTLIFQVGKERFRSLNEVSSPDVMRRIQAIARDLWVIVSGGSGSMNVIPPGNNSSANPGLRPISPPAAPMPQSTPRQTGTMGRIVGNSKRSEPETPLGIAAQIENFLQNRLAGSPLDSRRIHIHPSIDGGVKIEVDGNYYDGVDEVPDPTIRKFLENVMESWSSSSSS